MRRRVIACAIEEVGRDGQLYSRGASGGCGRGGRARRQARFGLSRTEYLRRRLVQEAVTPLRPVMTQDLEIFAVQFSELADPDIMRAAWE